MGVYSKTGKECLYLNVAIHFNENSVVVREDGSVNLDIEEERMRETTKAIEKSQEICTDGECGVLAYSSALALQNTVAKILEREFSIKQRNEDQITS